jgi:integral membrane sensor domain MASE1
MLFFAPLAVLGNAAAAVLRFPEIGAAVLFVPYAALAAVLLFAPARHWPWYVLVGALAHFGAHWPRWSFSWVMLAELANVARALTAAVTLRWIFGGVPRLDSVRSLLAFVAGAVVLAPAVGATIGAASVVFHEPSLPYLDTWAVWFMSNALTGLTLLPALIYAIAAYEKRCQGFAFEKNQMVEALGMIVLLALSCGLAFPLPRAGHCRSCCRCMLLFPP